MTGDILARLQAAHSDAEREWVVMEWSLANLEPELREAVWAAAIPHWFDLDYLAALLDRPAEAVRPIYQRLITLSYVEVFPGRGHNVHERTRNLLLDRLWDDDRERYLVLSQRAAVFCAQRDQDETGWRVETIYHRLIVEPEAGASDLQNMGWTWQNSPNFAYDKVEAMARAGREHLDAGRLSGRPAGWTLFWEAHLDKIYSRNHAAKEKLLAIDIPADQDMWLAADSIKALGDVHVRLSEYAAARARYEEAQPIYRAIGDRLGEANCIQALGDVHVMLSEYAAARARYEEAQGSYRAIGARLGEANCIQALGDVHVRLSEYPEARARYEEAQGIYRAIGDRLGEANCIKALGDVSLEERDETAALAAYQEAFERYMALGLPYAAGGVLASQTSIYDRRKEYSLSLPLHTRAIELAPANPMWYRNRALCYINLKDSEHALEDLETAARLQPDHPYLHLRRGDIALLHKDYAAAAHHYAAFIGVLPRNTAGHYGLAKAYFGQRRTEEALAALKRMLELTYSQQDVLDDIDDLIEMRDADPGLSDIDHGVALLREWLAQRQE